MNREIKFRAWNRKRIYEWKESGLTEDRGKFEFNSYEKKENTLICYSKEWGDDDIIIMQFTGLKDKNGKDIYEGDIVEVDWNDARYAKHNVEVIWNEINLCWEIAGGCLTADNNHFEVIGNIFENPELKTEL